MRTRFAACVLSALPALAGCAREEAPPADDVATPQAAAPQTPAMAITIDDLPWIGAVRPGETRADALQRVIDHLVSRDVPAMAFANCERAGAGAPLLRSWLDAGLELGNHSAAHLDLNDAPLERWLADVSICHDLVRELSGRDTVWFRYPFLHQGPSPERQQAALALLGELESPIAHVTIDNSDWILAVAYGNAITAGDSTRAAAIGGAFVDHIVRATQHYQNVARDRVERDVAHVLLLHANLLVSDYIGALLDRLRDELGFRFISVADAHRDVVYHRPDDYTGAQGLSWLYRFEPAQPELAEWDDEEARRLRAEWR